MNATTTARAPDNFHVGALVLYKGKRHEVDHLRMFDDPNLLALKNQDGSTVFPANAADCRLVPPKSKAAARADRAAARRAANAIEQRVTTLTEIAAKHLGLETLATRNSDALDFGDLAVWQIREALEAAYAAGAAAAAAAAKA